MYLLLFSPPASPLLPPHQAGEEHTCRSYKDVAGELYIDQQHTQFPGKREVGEGEETKREPSFAAKHRFIHCEMCYKDRYGEERRDKKEQFVSILSVQALAQEQEVEDKSLTHCPGNIALPIDTTASLKFPERRYTTEILVHSTAAEHILSFQDMVLHTGRFIHWSLGKKITKTNKSKKKKKNPKAEKLQQHSKGYLPD